jgi:hypothetical protein
MIPLDLITNPERIPGESFLISCLQKNINFAINNKTIKKGRLLLFRQFHYFVQIAILTEKGLKENFDIPFPFKIEKYPEEGLMYFDYRTKSLEVEALPQITNKINSIYFNKILEIYTV